MTSPDLLEDIRSGAVLGEASFSDYDAGLLNDWGGGNVDWWQDYLRAEIGRANDFWRSQVASPDHTPDLVALIEGRAQSHCCVEDASEPCGPFSEVCKERDAALAERDALRERVAALDHECQSSMATISAERERAERAEGASKAIHDVVTERRRQVAEEGWLPEHDDAHSGGELALAGGWYAFNSVYRGPDCIGNVADGDCEANSLFRARRGHGAYQWPWGMSWWKPSEDPRRDLVKAGALILAEIERLDRALTQETPNVGE